MAVGLLPRLILVVALAVAPGLAVQLLGLAEQRRQALSGIAETALLKARQVVAEKNEVLTGAEYLFVALSQATPALISDPAACDALATRLAAVYSRFDAIGAVDADGRLLCANEAAKALDAIGSLDLTTGVTDALLLGRHAQSSSGGVLPLLYPTRVEGQRITLFALVDLEWLADWLKDRPLPEGAFIQMTDRDGTVLARWPGHARWTGERIPTRSAVPFDDSPRSVLTRGDDGVTRMHAIVPLSEGLSGVTAVVGLPVRPALAEVWIVTMRNLVLIVAGFAVGALLALYGAQRLFLRPVRDLGEAARNWGAGDLRASAGLRDAPAEFRQLAKQLEDMARRLSEREAQLVAAHAAAAEASRTKGRLLAAAGHDLKQPVQAIGLAASLLESQTSESGKKLVTMTRRAVTKLGRALDVLVEMSRLESGLKQPHRQAFEIGELLAELGDEWRLAAAEKGLRLRVVRCSRLVDSDRDMLATILGNLLANAIRYTDRGGILVGCRPAGNSLRIQVCDTGIGIAQDALDRIWGEFHQIDPSRREGFGLGLSIVQRTAEMLDHRLDVRSAPGRGSCFEVNVPLATVGVPA